MSSKDEDLLLRDAMAFRKIKSLAIQYGEVDVECNAEAAAEFGLAPWAIVIGVPQNENSEFSYGKTIHEALERLSE